MGESVIKAAVNIARIVLVPERREMLKTCQQALLKFGLSQGLKKKRPGFSAFARFRNVLVRECLEVAYV